MTNKKPMSSPGLSSVLPNKILIDINLSTNMVEADLGTDVSHPSPLLMANDCGISELMKYQDKESLYEFQVFPNRGVYKKFENCVRSFVLMGVYSKDSFDLMFFKIMAEDEMKKFIDDRGLKRVYNAVAYI
jgi:hypothetical protein